jgi:hypothetical protein
MIEFLETALDNAMDEIREYKRLSQVQEASYRALAARYDEAMKRIHDMQAELEHLRREVNRG